MGEIVSEDVLDDLAEIQKLLAGQPLDQPAGEGGGAHAAVWCGPSAR